MAIVVQTLPTDQTTPAQDSQPLVPLDCPAHHLTPAQRRQLALATLAGQSVSLLAQQHQVSRKFVYQQRDIAHDALEQAFAPRPDDQEKVLFYLPVTRSLLCQIVLTLVLTCHSSLRGVSEFLAAVFDYRLSLGSVFNIVHAAVARARQITDSQDLSAIRVGADDEIFQGGQPVLVGVDTRSTYCYLLSPEQHRDGDTWGVRLLELAERRFQPEATIADAGSGMRSGHEQALPGVPCRGDVFHCFYAVGPLVRYLENRAYEIMETVDKLSRKQEKHAWRKGRKDQKVAQQLQHTQKAQAKAIALAEDVATLYTWLREDILAVAGPDYASRRVLLDFVVSELVQREGQCEHRIRPIRTLLVNQGADLLAFAAALDKDLAVLASEWQVSAETVRQVLQTQQLSEKDSRRWQREATHRQQLGGRYYALNAAVAALAGGVVRASSLVENVNSRLRNYFFLSRHLGSDYLALLQFYLNHRRYLRSEQPERVGKSPAELLSGQEHSHWLEMLGYQRFRRAA
jgi:hypothetical protein